jgi:hypothetical protein
MLTWKFDILQQNPVSRNTRTIHSFIFTNYNKDQSFLKRYSKFYDFNSDKIKLKLLLRACKV